MRSCRATLPPSVLRVRVTRPPVRATGATVAAPVPANTGIDGRRRLNAVVHLRATTPGLVPVVSAGIPIPLVQVPPPTRLGERRPRGPAGPLTGPAALASRQAPALRTAITRPSVLPATGAGALRQVALVVRLVLVAVRVTAAVRRTAIIPSAVPALTRAAH